MRKLIMYCDRCKKEFKKWNNKQHEIIGVGEIMYDAGEPYLDYQKDLCESCYVELIKWWDFKSQERGITDYQKYINALRKCAKEHENDITLSRNMEEIKEVINCDANAETKCKMISNILTAEPHYFEEPQESEDNNA